MNFIFDRSHNPPARTDLSSCRRKTHVHASPGAPCLCGKTPWKQCDCGEPAYRLKKTYPVCPRCDALEEIGYEDYTTGNL